MISLKKTNHPKIKMVKMNCDKPLHKKLEKYEMINDCFNISGQITMVLGPQGSGKTTYVTSLFQHVLNGCFENIFLIMPEKSFDDIVNNPFKKWLEPHEIFHELDEEILQEIHEAVLANCNAGENTAVIIDDFQRLFKDKKVYKVFQKFVTEVRHLNCSVFSLQQNYKKMPLEFRELIFNIIMFDMGKSQNTKVFIENFEIPPAVFDKIIKLYKKKGDFLCVNLKSKKFYFNYDEIIFDD